MVFNNVYEMITPPIEQKKSWFVDYFCGDILNPWWTVNEIVGSGTSTIKDALNGGYSYTTGTIVNSRTVIGFCNIRHYCENASVFIAVHRKTSTMCGRTDIGFASNICGFDNGISYRDNSTCTFNLLVGSNTTATSTGVAVCGAAFAHIKIRLYCTTSTVSVNGVFRATHSCCLPSVKVQPDFYNQTTAACNTKEHQISYVEVYNT